MWGHNDLWLGKVEGLCSLNDRGRHWLGLVQFSIHWNISFVATSIAKIVMRLIVYRLRMILWLRLRIIQWLASVTSSLVASIIVNWSIYRFTMFIFGRFMWGHNDLWLGKIEGLWSVNNRCRHWLGLVQLSIHWNISFVATSIAMIVLRLRIILWLMLYFISVTISWRLIILRLRLRLRIILRLYFISVSSPLRLIVWPVSCGMVGLVWPVSCGMVGLMWPVYWSVAWVLVFIYFIGSDVLIGSIIIRARVRRYLIQILIVTGQGSSTKYTN